METINEVEEFLFERGNLHDCKINNIAWSLKSNRLEVSILDLNANFIGLPEYLGLQPGRLIFDGVRSVQGDVSPSGDNLRIYEASFSVREDLQVVEFLLSPAGNFVVHSTAVSFELLLVCL